MTKEVTDLVDVHLEYDTVDFVKCICGRRFHNFELDIPTLDTLKEDRKEGFQHVGMCPDCGRVFYCEINVKIFELYEE